MAHRLALLWRIVDDAVAWAQRIPTASYGSVEVRPIVDFDG